MKGRPSDNLSKMPLTPIEKLPDQSVKEMGEGELTKAAIRQTVWKYLESNNLVKFPRPVYRRIPNFEGAAAAGEKAATLDEFKNAKVIKINPDKPQENSRFLTLEAEKTLLVPTPRLRDGLFNKINPPAGCGKDVLRTCATAQGVREHSSPISLDDTINVDLVIVGSVAVSKTGLRIGKGEGFADMEFAMMRCMKAVNENTVVITTVHDCQIIDIPESLMEAHDLTVDYIVTETQIIKCNRTRPKPEGIIWSKITPEKVRQVPILRVMREKDKEAGKDTTLKDGREESDLPEREENEHEDGENRRPYRRRPYQYRRRFRRYRDSHSKEDGENEAGGDHGDVNGAKSESGNEEGQDKPKGRPRRQFFRRRRFRRRRNENSQGGGESDEHGENRDESDEGRLDNENQENRPPRRRQRFRRQPRQRRNDSGENEGEGENQENERPRDNRRRRPKNRSQSEGNESGNENQENRRRRPFRPRKSMPTIFFGSLPRSLRVSELKSKVRENDINPLRVIWNGGQGHAFFQFQNNSEMEAALESLKDFEIKGRKLRIEVANRSRPRGDNSDKEGSANDQPEEVAAQSQAIANNGENAS